MLRISKPALDALRRHGEQTYPQECCGVLLGSLADGVRTVQEAAVCHNAREDSPENRYDIAPKELIAVQKRAREKGLDILGFYHSHPGSPARWSQTDLDEAHWLGCSYVITSVEGGVASRTASFLLAGDGEEDKRLEDEPLEIL